MSGRQGLISFLFLIDSIGTSFHVEKEDFMARKDGRERERKRKSTHCTGQEKYRRVFGDFKLIQREMGCYRKLRFGAKI